MNVNTAMIVGRLTRDPEMKALPSGGEVTNFSVATSSTFVDRDGKKQEQTEYHNVVVFGKQANPCGTYLVKGQLVAIQGKLQTRSWEKDGVKHYRTEVVADRVQFGPKAGDNGQASQARAEEPEDINPDDIPF